MYYVHLVFILTNEMNQPFIDFFLGNINKLIEDMAWRRGWEMRWVEAQGD